MATRAPTRIDTLPAVPTTSRSRRSLRQASATSSRACSRRTSVPDDLAERRPAADPDRARRLAHLGPLQRPREHERARPPRDVDEAEVGGAEAAVKARPQVALLRLEALARARPAGHDGVVRAFGYLEGVDEDDPAAAVDRTAL